MHAGTTEVAVARVDADAPSAVGSLDVDVRVEAVDSRARRRVEDLVGALVRPCLAVVPHAARDDPLARRARGVRDHPGGVADRREDVLGAARDVRVAREQVKATGERHVDARRRDG